MICFTTSNQLSHTVMDAVSAGKRRVRSIKEFNQHPLEPSVFYGILRGCGRAMHVLESAKIDYWYIDNGYFDARYIDDSKRKDMGGTFRIVKNDMLDVFPGKPEVHTDWRNVLILPPSPYSANFYDTTPEDWSHSVYHSLLQHSPKAKIRFRDKGAMRPLDEELNEVDAVIAFNSMALMRAAEMGVAVADTHGFLRNLHIDQGAPHYDIGALRAFYEPKQFTLAQIREGAVEWK